MAFALLISAASMYSRILSLVLIKGVETESVWEAIH